MTGTKEGSRKAVAAILAKNPNHFAEIGRKGGSVVTGLPKGFAAMDPEKQREASIKGGRISRRRKMS